MFNTNWLYLKDGGIASPRKNGHTKQSRYAHQGNLYFPTKEKREGPVERFLIGLRDFAIEKVVSHVPPVFEAKWTGKNSCPHCACEKLRIKDSFWRSIRNISIHGRASRLLVRCHKYRCESCGRYFNTRLAGIKVWSRTTELLKRNIFQAYNKGISCKEIANEHRIGVASVERYYHQMMQHTSSHWVNRTCPRILGIDEHRFTRRQGFATTFCGNPPIFRSPYK